MKLDFVKDGEISLIMIKEGRVAQLAIPTEVHNAITMVLAKFSEKNQFVLMGEDYDLVLKSTVKTFKK